MKIFTIGHTNHSFRKLVRLLKANSIDVLVDVRGLAGIFNQHYFQKAALKNVLKMNKIKYLYLGDHFEILSGKDPIEQVIKSEKVYQSVDLQIGINRLEAGINKGYTLSIMGIEENPAKCRQFRYINQELQAKGIDIFNIRGNGTLEHGTTLPTPLQQLNQPEINSSKRNFKTIVMDALVNWKRKKQELGLQLVD